MLLLRVALFFHLQILLLCGKNDKPYEIPTPEVQIFEPKGLRVCIPDAEGINMIAFNANVNKPIPGGSNDGQISVTLTAATSLGRWTIIDENITLNVGDNIYYTIYLHKGDTSYGLDGHFVVKHHSDKPIATHHYHSCGPDAHRSCIRNLFRKKPKHEVTRTAPITQQIDPRFG